MLSIAKSNGKDGAHVLVVSNETTTLRSVWDVLSSDSCELETASSGLEALQKIRAESHPDLILLDLFLADSDGLDVLHRIHETHPEISVVVLSPYEDTRQMAEALRLGAQDYLTKPVRKLDLHLILNRYLGRYLNGLQETPDLKVEELAEGLFFAAASSSMHKIRAQAELLANIDAPVLLLGESGTGKEITARLIHKLSSTSNRTFLKVNCAALPTDLLESELFGYERGAFTGAVQSKPGQFEMCEKGTILLDEIGELPNSLQAKLLHVLQDKQFSRLGGRSPISVNVRILAATNVDISHAIATKQLRDDLYYRLSPFTIELPPLRERQQEIPVLLKYFMHRLAKRYSRTALPLSAELLQACQQYSWPGNVRELENFVRRYLVMGDEEQAICDLRALPHRKPAEVLLGEQPAKPKPTPEKEPGSGNGSSDLKSLVRNVKGEAEVTAIMSALTQTHWNRRQAARLLKISYRGLLYKIRQYSLSPPTETPGS